MGYSSFSVSLLGVYRFTCSCVHKLQEIGTIFPIFIMFTPLNYFCCLSALASNSTRKLNKSRNGQLVLDFRGDASRVSPLRSRVAWDCKYINSVAIQYLLWGVITEDSYKLSILEIFSNFQHLQRWSYFIVFDLRTMWMHHLFKHLNFEKLVKGKIKYNLKVQWKLLCSLWP